MDDYISKPLKPKLLIQTITKCIHNIKQLKELSKNNNRTSNFAKNLKLGSLNNNEQANKIPNIGIEYFGDDNGKMIGNSMSPNLESYGTINSPKIRKAYSNDIIRPGQLTMDNRSATESELELHKIEASVEDLESENLRSTNVVLKQ